MDNTHLLLKLFCLSLKNIKTLHSGYFIMKETFCLGAKILDNIQNAVENSNIAILLICQKFIDSVWCVEEFERCHQESRKDPDFKLFLILMEPAESFVNLPKIMENYLQNKTFAKVDDVNTYKK